MFAHVNSKKTIGLILGFVLVAFMATPGIAGIVGSKHDFASITTPSGDPSALKGQFKYVDYIGANVEIDDPCVFCHTPHHSVTGAAAPLWNRSTDWAVNNGWQYSMYTSATMSANNPVSGRPMGVSALCMSCHDGVTSIAVNTLINPPGTGAPNTVTTILNGGPPNTGAIGDAIYPDVLGNGWRSNLGELRPQFNNKLTDKINLSNDHPISIKYQEAAGMNPIAGIDSRLRLFGTNPDQTVECATCHLVHDPTYPPFLAMPNTGSGMCVSCHNK